MGDLKNGPLLSYSSRPVVSVFLHSSNLRTTETDFDSLRSSSLQVYLFRCLLYAVSTNSYLASQRERVLLQSRPRVARRIY